MGVGGILQNMFDQQRMRSWKIKASKVMKIG
jgi:hypothetical protein